MNDRSEGLARLYSSPQKLVAGTFPNADAVIHKRPKLPTAGIAHLSHGVAGASASRLGRRRRLRSGGNRAGQQGQKKSTYGAGHMEVQASFLLGANLLQNRLVA